MSDFVDVPAMFWGVLQNQGIFGVIADIFWIVLFVLLKNYVFSLIQDILTNKYTKPNFIALGLLAALFLSDSTLIAIIFPPTLPDSSALSIVKRASKASAIVGGKWALESYYNCAIGQTYTVSYNKDDKYPLLTITNKDEGIQQAYISTVNSDSKSIVTSGDASYIYKRIDEDHMEIHPDLATFSEKVTRFKLCN